MEPLAGLRTEAQIHGFPTVIDLPKVRVAVVEAVSDRERKSSPAGQRALALARGSAQILDQLGVWAEIKPAATRIDTARGERWFCSAAEAIAAGWTAAAR